MDGNGRTPVASAHRARRARWVGAHSTPLGTGQWRIQKAIRPCPIRSVNRYGWCTTTRITVMHGDLKGQSSRSPTWSKVKTYLRNGSDTNFRLAIPMEYDEPHHRQAQLPWTTDRYAFYCDLRENSQSHVTRNETKITLV